MTSKGAPAKSGGKKAAKASGKEAPASKGPERFKVVQAALGKEIGRLFPQATRVHDWGLDGWRIARPTKITGWKGTIDPNFIHIYLADRKGGITLHLWNSYDPGGLKRQRKDFERAGFKVMVGCLQFNRVGEYPLGAVVGLLEDIRTLMDAES